MTRKVPKVIALFWILKLFTTAMGEAASDFLVHSLNPMYAVAIGAVGFSVAILLQLTTRKYIAWMYWLALTMVALFGTMAADVVHIVLGVPYVLSTAIFTVVLVSVFFLWHKTERSLSIHSITTTRRELFYWTTVITAFALGTALGDTTAVSFHWGYLLSGIIFIVLFLLPLCLQKFFKINEVATFWIAYIFTRPLGASFADWLGRTPDLGGIGFGTGKTTLVLAVLISACVAYLTLTKIDVDANTHE